METMLTNTRAIDSFTRLSNSKITAIRTLWFYSFDPFVVELRSPAERGGGSVYKSS